MRLGLSDVELGRRTRSVSILVLYSTDGHQGPVTSGAQENLRIKIKRNSLRHTTPLQRENPVTSFAPITPVRHRITNIIELCTPSYSAPFN